MRRESEYARRKLPRARARHLPDPVGAQGLDLVERRWVAARGSERTQRFQRRLARTCIRRHQAKPRVGPAGTLSREQGREGRQSGQGGLRPLAAALAAARAHGAVLVGTDSGPTHLAAALDLPTVMLSGPQDPDRTGPWPLPSASGSPHRVLRAAADRLAPMDELMPEHVAAALLDRAH